MSKLSRITIKGYKSIQSLEGFELSNLNILLGANGAGKSNFISVFKLLANIDEQNLQLYIQKNGGADVFLYYGRKKTERISMLFHLETKGYYFSLVPTLGNRLIFEKDFFWYTNEHNCPLTSSSSGNDETLLSNIKDSSGNEVFRNVIENLRVYHFHDTSDSAFVKQTHLANDNLRLKTDAANLAAFLLKLKKKYPKNYEQIVKTIQLVAPFFSDFVNRDDEESIQLEWFEKGNLDTPFKAHVLSDGTLRFICLATLLLQPFELMNDTILIDEPELGLHPYALAVLADLIKRAADKKQLIISTQSVELINHFSANDIIVVDRVNDASTFKRLDEDQLKDWLEDYTLGELWKQNIIGGRPSR